MPSDRTPVLSGWLSEIHMDKDISSSVSPHLREKAAPAQSALNASVVELPVGELIQYWCAVAVGEELHFTRAAQRLHLDQSALSRHILKLEAKLGFKLFVRSARGVELTDAGKSFLPFARKSLISGNQGERRGHAIACGNRLELEVAYSPLVDMHLIAQIRKVIDSAHFSVPIGFQSFASERLAARLLDGRSHTAIGILPVEEDIETVCLLRERLYVALPAGHRLAPQAVIEAAQLAGEPVIWALGARESAASKQLISLFQGAGCLLKVTREAQSVSEGLGLVREGFGVAIVKASELRLHAEGIVLCPFTEPGLIVETGLLYTPEPKWEFLAEFIALVGGNLRCSEPGIPN